jgi:hypothetical protein
MTTNNHPDTSTASNEPDIKALDDIRLRSGRSADICFYDAIKEHVLERAPSLDPTLIYIAAKICGKDFWGCLEDGERNLAGECILHMAIHEEIPLEPAGKNSENHQLYRVVVGFQNNGAKEVKAA